MKFKLGAVVRVRGQQVEMTVSCITKYNNTYILIDCVWFDANLALHKNQFNSELLELL